MPPVDLNRDAEPFQPSGADIRITWAGHATVLLEMNSLRLLTDPALGRRVGLLRRIAPPAPGEVADAIDVVLLSHLHSDHVDLPSLRRVGDAVPVVAPPAVAAWLDARGFSHVETVSAGSVARAGRVAIEATPARHDGRRWPRGPAAEAVGFLIEGERSVYFAGDTDLFPEMASLAGRVDVALIPVWGWGPALGPGHLDPERAAEAIALIHPRWAIPIHWGTLAPLSARPAPDAIARPPHAFAAAVARVAPDVEVRVLGPGGSASLDRAGRWCEHPLTLRAAAVAHGRRRGDDRRHGEPSGRR